MDKYTWITCPNCGRKFFKLYSGDVRLETVCPSCGGKYEIEIINEAVSTEERKRPKRFGPQEYK